MIVLVLEKGDLIMPPVVTAPGVLDPEEDRELIRALEEEVEATVLKSTAASKKGKVIERLEQVTRSAIRRIIRKEIGKTPPIEFIIRDMAHYYAKGRR